jgi:hypothetical protein
MGDDWIDNPKADDFELAARLAVAPGVDAAVQQILSPLEDNVVPIRRRRRTRNQGQTQHRSPDAGPLLHFHDVHPILDAHDFLEGLLTTEGMSLIYGKWSAGKTFFAVDLALHIACGWTWNGREIARGAALYCALEGGHGIINRVAAFKQEYGLDALPFAIRRGPVDLLDGHGVDDVLEAIKQLQAASGLPVTIVVIDTLSRALAGGDENSPEDMGALINNADRIQQEGKCHVALVHHMGKDEDRGARGHSLLSAAMDTMIETLADETGNHTARVTKQRDLEAGGEFNFTLKVIELGGNSRGKPVTSCVVDYANGATPVLRASAGNGKKFSHKSRALEILTDILAQSGVAGFHGAPPDVLSAPDKWWREQFYARAMPAEEQEAKKKAFQRAARELIGQHVVGMCNHRVWLVGRISQ